MRDLATSVREYYDQAANPVTADEIFRRLVTDAAPAPRRLRPAWVVAVSAVLVFIVIGGVGLLSLLRDDSVVTDEPMPTTTLPTTPIPSNDFTTMIAPDLPLQLMGSLVLTADEAPVVLYVAEEQTSAVLITCMDPACSSHVETVVAEFSTFGHVSDVAIGADRLAVFAFSDFDDATLTAQPGVVHCSDATCSSRAVETFDFDSEGMAPVLAIDAAGLPALVFTDWDQDGQVGTYRFVRCLDASCSEYTVGAIADAGGPPVLEFDASEMPLVAFNRNRSDAKSAELVMVACSDAACSQGGSSTVVVETPINAHSIDMTFGADGNPIFVFGEPKLSVAHCLEPTCATSAEVSVISLDVEGTRAIEIGDDGLPIIAYTFLTPEVMRELRVASCVDAACTEGTIEVLASDSWMIGIDMVLGSSGNPVLAFQADTSVGVTTCTDPSCSLESQRRFRWTQVEFEIPESTIADATGWTKVESFDAGESQSYFRASASGSDGGIIVGTRGGEPTAWTSSDGNTWTAFTIAPHGDVMDVAASDLGFIAVGATCEELWRSGEGDTPCDPAIWKSNDGAATWALVSDGDEFGGCSSLTAPSEFGCQTWVDGVEVTETGLVATGVDIVRGIEPNRSVAWTSSDGLAWNQIVPSDPTSTAPTPDAANRPPYPEFVDYTPWNDGLYGLGTRCTELGSSLTCQPFGWTSVDGAEWEPVELDPLDFGANDHAAFIEDGIHLVSGEFGLLALGSNIDPTTWDETPMMFLSVDGEKWTPFRLDPEMWGTNALVSFGDRVMAFGVGGVWTWTPGDAAP